jgi:hypothetical protein
MIKAEEYIYKMERFHGRVISPFAKTLIKKYDAYLIGIGKNSAPSLAGRMNCQKDT